MYTEGSMTAKLDVVSFEMFRYACDIFYAGQSTDIHSVIIDPSKDIIGNVVQYSYCVKCEADSSYTINVNLTKCSLLINGKQTSKLMQHHLMKLHEIMTQIEIDERSVDIKEMNKISLTTKSYARII